MSMSRFMYHGFTEVDADIRNRSTREKKQRIASRSPSPRNLPIAFVLALIIGQIVLAAESHAQGTEATPQLYQYYSNSPDAPDTKTTLQSSALASGSTNLSFPIEAPKGSGGLAPNLALVYNSRNSRGNAGKGWSLELPRITRSVRYGTDKAQTDEIQNAVYEYDGVELIPSSQQINIPGCFHARRFYPEISKDEIIGFCDNPEDPYWVVMYRDGSWISFGRRDKPTLGNAQSRLKRGNVFFEYYADEYRNRHNLSWLAFYSAYGDGQPYSAPRLEHIDYTYSYTDLIGTDHYDNRRIDITSSG